MPLFIAALRSTGTVRAACEAAGITRRAAYVARARNPRFSAEWDSAIEEACDELEAIARQRAKETSDTLLIFLLKAHRPEKYRETNRVEHSGVNGNPIQIEAFNYRAAIAALAPAEAGSMGDSDAPGAD